MTIDDLLTETRDVPSASDEAIATTQQVVLADVHSSIARIRKMAKQRARRRRLAGAIVATAACGAALLVIPRGSDGPPSTMATSPDVGPPSTTATASPTSPPVVDVDYKNASQVLTATAAALGPQDIPQDSDAFWRVELVDHFPGGPSVSRTVWSSRDAGVYIQDSRDRPEGAHIGGPAAFGTSGRILTWDALFELPTDKASMLSLLRGSSGRADADRVAFKIVFELLSTSPAPRKVRRALWLAAADLDGVALVGRMADAMGRHGWALTDGTSTYIVSPETGRLLESRYKSPDGIVYSTTMLREGPTTTAPKVTPRER